jgi:hypothetical protein
MDAFWRLFGFHTYPASDPAVRIIKVKLPSVLNYLSYSQLKSCDLWVYLNRPNCLKEFKYTDIFRDYMVYLALPKYYLNNENLLDIEYFVIQDRGLPFPVYLCKRIKAAKSIVRMEMVYVMAGEIWYFRLILLHRAITSIKDAYTGLNGIVYSSFQEAALSYGYVKNGNEGLQCFRQVINLLLKIF